ncbi:hypothetical protein MOSE0_M01442 [Monosporozyma servazzii]
MSGESSIRVAVRIRPFTPFETLHLTPTNDTDVNLVSSEESEDDDSDDDDDCGFNDTISNIAMPNGVWKLVDCVDDKMLVFDPRDRTPLNSMSVNLMNKRRHRRGKNKKKDGTDGENRYMFDRVFDVDVGQEQVYGELMVPLLDSVMAGYNGTIFAYGATGCGKTYTISGCPGDPGIIYRTMSDIYSRMDAGDKSMKLTLSFCEIYNENIIDLLRPETPSGKLVIREDGRGKIKISNLSEYHPVSVDEVLRLVDMGNVNRTTHATEANSVSSRSHSILQISIEQVVRDGDSVVNGILSIIDLAGSERASMTKNRGHRLVETGNINKSLLALGNCINALCQESCVHVPYRDSKLTRLLQFSLGGNCKTVMIVCISPSSEHYDETLNTLKYANRAKDIKTKSIKNEMNLVKHVGSYVKIIQSQRATIERLLLEIDRLSNSSSKDREDTNRDAVVDEQKIMIQSLILVKRRFLQVMMQIVTNAADRGLIEDEIALLERNYSGDKTGSEANEIMVRSSLILDELLNDDRMGSVLRGDNNSSIDNNNNNNNNNNNSKPLIEEISDEFNRFSERYLGA